MRVQSQDNTSYCRINMYICIIVIAAKRGLAPCAGAQSVSCCGEDRGVRPVGFGKALRQGARSYWLAGSLCPAADCASMKSSAARSWITPSLITMLIAR